jgi:cytoskeletal protein RodZ
VTGDRDDDPDGRPWHERTSTVVGASVAGLAVIGILFLLISYIARDVNAPDQAPQYYLDEPSASSRTSSTSATTTTETVTSTSPPVTTDINGDETTTSSSDTTTTIPPTTRRTTTTDDGGASTSRSRPRLNETRTLYPRP